MATTEAPMLNLRMEYPRSDKYEYEARLVRLNLDEEADAIEAAVNKAIEDGCRTADIIGKAACSPLSCTEMTDAIIARL